MEHKSAHYTFFLLVGILLIIGTSISRRSISYPLISPPLVENENSSKTHDVLFPNELFYYDRNYPDYDASPDLYQQHLKNAISYDKASSRNHRGLDAPWKVEGPGNIGGRVNTIAIHPLDQNIILIGYSQGGIYRTNNGGMDWSPVFDDQTSLSISEITFDPHDPDRIYATTGDVNISGYPFLGSGIYRSDDAGLTWSFTGLSGTGVLSKIAVDPNNGNILYVGSMGYPSQKGNERGLFRSIDRGQSWEKTLTIDDSTGVIDLVTDANQPGRVFATGWTRLRSNKISTTVGPGTDVFRSDDYGATWQNLQDGLPGDFHSRTSIDITTDGTLFVSYMGTINEGECAGYIESLRGIYKSIDGGISWDTIPAAPFNGLPCDLFGGFGWYNEVLKVNPENPQDIFLLGIDIYRTLDGGNSWSPAAPVWWTYEVHADKHDLVFSGGNMYLGTDGGAYMCPIDQSTPWSDIENIPSTQFYRTTLNPHQPDQYIGGAQDNGTSSGNASSINNWERLFGGDGFQPRFDPTEPGWKYFMTQYGQIYWSQDSGMNYVKLDKGIIGSRYWDMPFIMSSQDPKILFCGSNSVYKIDMRDTSLTWKSISPDLTKGEIILGNRYPAITAIAQSDLDEMRFYAGTQDGLIWTSPDGGMNWNNITDGTPGYYVTSITTSTINPLGVFATYSGYRDNDHTPYIFRSEDAGESWSSVGVNIPMLGVNSLLIFPGWNDEILFAATDGGVYVSFDAGDVWDRLGTNFPYMPVYDLELNPVENTIVAATFSRGLMTFPVDELDLVSAVDPVNQEKFGDQVNIYPTIVEDRITIDFEKYKGELGKFDIIIFDIGGHVIQENNINVPDSKIFNWTISNDISPGVYFIKISNHRGLISTRIFIKQ